MYCAVCGKEMENDVAYCPDCGRKVKEEANVPAKKQTEKKVQVSLILGIIGIVLAWLFALLGHAVSIIGIVLGVREYKETEKTAGLVVSIIGEACSIISSIIGLAALFSLF